MIDHYGKSFSKMTNGYVPLVDSTMSSIPQSPHATTTRFLHAMSNTTGANSGAGTAYPLR